MKKLCSVICIALVLVIFCFSQPTIYANPDMQVVLTDTGISPSSIRAAKGQMLRIRVVNAGGKTHNFVIPDMFIFSPNLASGESTSISFTPDKAGRFRYYSDTGGKPEPGLSGTLNVSP